MLYTQGIKFHVTMHSGSPLIKISTPRAVTSCATLSWKMGIRADGTGIVSKKIFPFTRADRRHDELRSSEYTCLNINL
jgi:hypothetical protein